MVEPCNPFLKEFVWNKLLVHSVRTNREVRIYSLCNESIVAIFIGCLCVCVCVCVCLCVSHTQTHTHTHVCVCVCVCQKKTKDRADGMSEKSARSPRRDSNLYLWDTRPSCVFCVCACVRLFCVRACVRVHLLRTVCDGEMDCRTLERFCILKYFGIFKTESSDQVKVRSAVLCRCLTTKTVLPITFVDVVGLVVSSFGMRHYLVRSKIAFSSGVYGKAFPRGRMLRGFSAAYGRRSRIPHLL